MKSISDVLNLLILLPALFLSQVLLSSPEAEISTKEWDIGAISSDAVIRKEFSVKNNGEDTLLIKKIHVSCRCLTYIITQGEAAKDDYLKFTIFLNSSLIHESDILKYVYIRLNDPKLSTYRIVIKGRLSRTEST